MQGVPVVPWQPGSGWTVVGVPVDFPGSTTFGSQVWEETIDKLTVELDRTTEFPDLQIAHHLIRSCLDGCKVNHLPRATDAYLFQEAIQKCDNCILTAFEDLVGCGLSEA